MVALNSTISFLLSSWSYFYGNDHLTVSTQYGRLEGSQAESRAGRTYYEFLGVPFAKPPVGELRFQAPLPPDPWHGVRSAKSRPYECIQYHLGRRVTGDEDCLYLNVYTHRVSPASASGKGPLDSDAHALELAPVMVYVHGGIFMMGGARIYGARYFMDHDVVLVVVQYRLGALGFLNTGDGVVRGNMGLKDQVMALRWVQDNIRNFGGDPGRVTLVGQSAGAVCAHLHTLSPMSRGLFQQLILQSGNALAPWGLKAIPAEQARRFATRLNCASATTTNSTTTTMIKCLRGLDATELVHGHDDFPHQIYERLVVFGPTIESGANDTDTFLDDAPLNLLRAGRAMQIPMMQGANALEGLLFAGTMIKNETIRAVLATNWTVYAPKFLGLDDHPQRAVLVERIRAHYLADNNASAGAGPELSMDNLLNLTNMLSDRNFFQPMHWLAEWNLEQQNEADGGTTMPTAPMYLYYYTYKGEFSIANFVLQLTRKLPQLLDVIVSTGMQWVSTNVFGNEPEHYGAGHADEIFMMFKLPILTQHEPGTKDYEMSRVMVDTWVSFVATGVPRLNGSTSACWMPVGKVCPGADEATGAGTGFQYMQLDNESQVILEPFRARLEFWESLGLNEKI